jgi:hypothetical protein
MNLPRAARAPTYKSRSLPVQVYSAVNLAALEHHADKRPVILPIHVADASALIAPVALAERRMSDNL